MSFLLEPALGYLPPRPVPPALDGSYREGKRLPNLFVGQAIPVAQDDRRPVVRPKGL